MNHFSRRRFAAAAFALACTLAPGSAFSQAYPSKPIRLIVGYQAGGPTDLTARLIATKLQVAL